MLRLVDVPTGSIHLDSVYLDAEAQKQVRTFGVTNTFREHVRVEIGSDLGGELLFWLGDDERGEQPDIYLHNDS